MNLHSVDNFILSNLILFAPLLLVMRRWRLPFGAVTFLFTVVATLMQALDAFHSPEVMVGCVVLVWTGLSGLGLTLLTASGVPQAK